MFGSFVHRGFIFLLFHSFGWGAGAPGFSQAKIINNGAIVYKGADFDSPHLGILGIGKIYDVFPKQFGPFFRIKVGQVYGYIADNDVQLIKDYKPEKPIEKNKERGTEVSSKKAEIKKQKPFAMTRYIGPSFNTVAFKEETLSAKRQENLGFLGLKLSGPEIVLEGESSSELNLQFFSGAPSYYEKLTGVPGSGFIFMLDLQFLSVTSMNKFVLFGYGFGPLFRFSKFELGLRDPATNKVTGYSAENMSLGVVFSADLAFRIGKCALRPEVKYYWEREQYYSLGTAFQFEF